MGYVVTAGIGILLSSSPLLRLSDDLCRPGLP